MLTVNDAIFVVNVHLANSCANQSTVQGQSFKAIDPLGRGMIFRNPNFHPVCTMELSSGAKWYIIHHTNCSRQLNGCGVQHYISYLFRELSLLGDESRRLVSSLEGEINMKVLYHYFSRIRKYLITLRTSCR